eukprot:CAMPEP_0206544256 /NCGR_PEP_ID=MMETSP0325_2-20121206/11409_1 /ASSEMBLY_ACC=CAM_ASM_000347 /TAXON_ID=2866 /ORGANISM="Crypthecodinium cohnii, Strain Seligo" /LENGTH=239 /DNA_ID=CAMNT_0054042969 /DNA_START=68 /DNA_END=784 /DNA_ORIENTATION=+
MPPRTVICDLCGGKFFAHSIDHHKKVCRDKVGKQNHECPYCHSGVPLLEMDAHILRCPEAKAIGAKPSGASAALANRLKRDRERPPGGHQAQQQARGMPGRGGSPAFGGGGGGSGPSEYEDDDLARVPCPSCGRKFAMDRVAKHQAICTKIASKGPRKTFQVQRTYNEGGSGGAVVGVASPAPKGRGRGGMGGAVEKNLANKPKPPPTRTNWREQSRAFREACRAGRQYPMPLWGQDNY